MLKVYHYKNKECFIGVFDFALTTIMFVKKKFPKFAKALKNKKNLAKI